MRKLSVILSVAALAAAAWSAPEYAGPVRAEEVRVRDGVGNLMRKLSAGRDVTIAYLGGSITAMDGWRNLTTEWFRRTWPNVKFTEVHASIGGTGSDLGAFRVGHDALCRRPDLLFVEFATNDGGARPEDIWRSMEGIVRQTWNADPSTDVVFAYTITHAMADDYGAGRCPRAASAMEQLADHYGIPSVCFGPRVAAEVKAGRLIMSRGELETAVPKDAPDRDRAISELLAREGRVLFAADGVHPSAEGHRLYLQSVTNAFAQMRASRPADHRARLATPFTADNLERAKMVEIDPGMLRGAWTKLPADDAKSKSFGGRMGDIWYAHEPGDALSFSFRGTCCRIYDLLGPDGGQVWVTVDGKRSAHPIPRFDSYCTYHRIATLYVFQGAEGVHTVEIEVDRDQPSRQGVAFRLKDPDRELAQPKYQGTKFWPAKIMLVGDLVR